MGRIKKTKDSITVELDLTEIIEAKAYMKLPEKPGFVWYDFIGNMISRAAWKKILEKAPRIWKEFNAVKVEGEGKVTVTFYLDPDKPISEFGKKE